MNIEQLGDFDLTTSSPVYYPGLSLSPPPPSPISSCSSYKGVYPSLETSVTLDLAAQSQEKGQGRKVGTGGETLSEGWRR